MKLSCSIKVFYMLVALMSFSVSSLAQEWHNMSQAAVDSILNPRLLDGADQIVRFDSVVSHIGKLTEDDSPIPIRFTFRNVGSAPLVFTTIRTDCGCTNAKADQLEYKTGEEGYIVVEYNPHNHPGTVDASTFVYSSQSSSHPVVKLTLLGEVLPSKDIWDRYHYSMGQLKLKRRVVRFNIHNGNVLTERILCGNSGENELKLVSGSLPDYITVTTQPEVIAPGEEADIVIRVDGSRVNKNISLPLTFQGIPFTDGCDRIMLELIIE